jgi:hypothetical protein
MAGYSGILPVMDGWAARSCCNFIVIAMSWLLVNAGYAVYLFNSSGRDIAGYAGCAARYPVELLHYFVTLAG